MQKMDNIYEKQKLSIMMAQKNITLKNFILKKE